MRFIENARLMMLAAIVVSGTAIAGFEGGQGVLISDENRLANGDLGYVHSAGGGAEFLGCTVHLDQGFCIARNANGVTRSCTTTDSRKVDTMRSLNGDSYLLFRWDASGVCTYLVVENFSSKAPKR